MDDWWAGFDRDPRVPGNAPLRAADRDRDVVRHLLTEAYADGRLDRAELDERTEQLDAARTLGDLPPLVADLVPAEPVPASRLPVRAEELRATAVDRWRSDRREAAFGLVAISTITTVIWAVTMLGGFFWPAFVIAAATLNLARLQFMREQKIGEHQRALEKKHRRQLERDEAQRRKEERADGDQP